MQNVKKIYLNLIPKMLIFFSDVLATLVGLSILDGLVALSVVVFTDVVAT